MKNFLSNDLNCDVDLLDFSYAMNVFDKFQMETTGIQSILANEKYTGNAYLGKTFKQDVLSKTRVKNIGQGNMYYVENSHPAIISQETFDLVQKEREKRNEVRSS